jgi:peroxiredoxin
MKMKKLIILGFLLLGTIHAMGQTQGVAVKQDSTKVDNRGYIVKIGDIAPADFKLALTSGETISLKSLRGKIVILQFTASWCSVCRKEMPHLESELWQKYKDRNVLLIGVDRDEPLEKVKAFKKNIKVTYPIALDPRADIFGRFAEKTSGVTRNVVIDQNGKIVFLTRLYNPEEFAKLLNVVEGLADKK